MDVIESNLVCLAASLKKKIPINGLGYAQFWIKTSHYNALFEIIINL